jgi:hypothetical protein
MTSITDFLSRKAEAQARDEAVATWHIEAHLGYCVPLPYSHDDTWINVNHYDEDYEIDTQKSLDNLASIARLCADKHLALGKEYDSDFNLVVEVPMPIGGTATIRYYADREAVCKKKVVGTKTIPARVVPEREEEIVEWECEPISLLARSQA